MRANPFACFCTLLILTFLFSCKKQNSDFTSDQLSDYISPQPGDYFIYRTDSTVFTKFGRNTELHSYMEKWVVDAQITDGMGRNSYRILRYMQDIAQTIGWQPSGSLLITPSSKTVEFIENNLRFVKMAYPISKGFQWKGNEYLPDLPYGAFYSFNNDASMSGWEYSYVNLNDTFSYNGSLLPGVINVTAINNPNYADTVNVTSTQVQLNNHSLFYFRGNASDTISISAPVPTDANFKLSLYNRTNQPLILGSISIPVGQGRNYQYINNQWTFGDLDGNGNRIDTLYSDLPYGSMDRSIDKYAKHVGLVYQEYTMWEYQPIYGSNDDGYKNGFGIIRRLVNHN